MYKVFPCAGKVPLIKNWQAEASVDPEKLKMWYGQFGSNLTHWGVPTGPTNGILVLDVDVKNGGYETIKKYDVPDTMFQQTQSGGVHYVFTYPTDGKRYGNKTSARDGHFLGSGVDARGEGGYILWYGGPGTDKPATVPPAWLTNAFHAVQNSPTASAPQGLQTVKVSPEIAGREIQESLKRIREAAQGERNHTLNAEAFKIGQLVASGSVSFEYAYDALARAAISVGLEANETRATVMSGLKGGHQNPIEVPFGQPQAIVTPFTLVTTDWTPSQTTMEELFDESKLRRPQLFQDWSTADIHLTTADGGTGKTTLKLYEAVCLSLGERFLGFNCVGQGRTLFITGEDTDKKLKAMLGKILRQMGLTEGDNQKVKAVLDGIWIKKDPDLCLIVKDPRTGFLSLNRNGLEPIVKAAEKIGNVKMIVFDPISSFWGSEAALNDMAKAVTKFMAELVERTGACVEMINHMGKKSSGDKDMSQFAGRGGTGLVSHSRVSRTLRPVDDKEYLEMTGESLTDKQSAMLCKVNKFTDGSPLYNKPFLIVRDGFLFSRKALTDQKAREAEQKLSDEERVFQFVHEARQARKFPSRKVIVAHFKACGDPIPKTRVESALDLIQYRGHLGEKIKEVENPDVVSGGKVYVITDDEGKEL